MEKKCNRPVDRIKELAQFYIDHNAFNSMTIFEKACGLSDRYVKNLVQTTHGNPGVETIAQIYRKFKGVNLHWLVLGEGDMFTIDEDEAIRYAKDAVFDVMKEKKVQSILDNKILADMNREEILDLVSRILEKKEK